MSMLIIGCGYLGMRVAKRAIAAGRTVHALTRAKSDEFRALGIQPISGDVTQIESLDLPHVDFVVHAVGLDRRSGRSMHDVYVGGLANVLDRLPSPPRFTYVSSSSVYGQTDGGWVDESSPTEPIEESGRVVLEAETLLRTRLPHATILRLSGIYGPGRVLRKAALLAGEPLVGDAEKWINLIHVDDAVDAVLKSESLAGQTLNICDDEPVTRRNLYTHTAERLGAPPAKFTPGPSGRGDTNRRIRNDLAKRALGWQLRHTNYRKGLEAC